MHGIQDVQTCLIDSEKSHMAWQLTRGGVFSEKRRWEQQKVGGEALGSNPLNWTVSENTRHPLDWPGSTPIFRFHYIVSQDHFLRRGPTDGAPIPCMHLCPDTEKNSCPIVSEATHVTFANDRLSSSVSLRCER